MFDSVEKTSLLWVGPYVNQKRFIKNVASGLAADESWALIDRKLPPHEHNRRRIRSTQRLR